MHRWNHPGLWGTDGPGCCTNPGGAGYYDLAMVKTAGMFLRVEGFMLSPQQRETRENRETVTCGAKSRGNTEIMIIHDAGG